MLSRVVPGTSETITRSASARLLMNVLLPTLRRPTMASFSADFAGRRPRRCPAGSFARMASNSSVLAELLIGADGERLAVAQPEELADLLGEFLGIGLVRDEDDRLLYRAEPIRDLLVERHDPFADIDDETPRPPPSRWPPESAARRRR